MKNVVLWLTGAPFLAFFFAVQRPDPPPVRGGAFISEESPFEDDFGGLEEALVGFDGRTNGFEGQAQFDKDANQFNEIEDIQKGVGPVTNARSCAECHKNPVLGGNSQVTEIRAGTFDGLRFIEPAGGSLIHAGAIAPEIQEHVLVDQNVRTLRLSPGLHGLGYVEAVESGLLAKIQARQPLAMRGEFHNVALLENASRFTINLIDNNDQPNKDHVTVGGVRVGRFGWKAQHASLLSFAADAYTNEVGVTNPFLPNENKSNGRDVNVFNRLNGVKDVQDVNGVDTRAFARFMRSLKAPPRDSVLAVTTEAQAGRKLFSRIGCSICHTPNLRTADANTAINEGALVVNAAIGGKVFHPYSDFMLHFLDSGDGVVQNDMPQSTRLKIRTAPLWGLRTRNRLMHDGMSFLRQEAIMRHGGEATLVRNRYLQLSDAEKQALLTFLRSL